MGFLPRRGGGRWRLRHVVLFVLLWMFLHRTVLGCSSINCNVVLTEAQGDFTSPCYPQKYPNSHTCKWTMQAPTGFIIQLSFLDFELEEAQDCMYDRVVVNTGSTESKFCGLTARGLTLNSTRNVMEVSFISDFSIQKKGFTVSFQHVLGCSSINCNVVLTEAQGDFTSPCYPQKYPNSHTCKWTMQAPTGFIIQLSFLDFELEEAQDCMYDRVVVNTGSTESKFCGLTARGLTLNSTRNVMEVSFISDFSIQKKGFTVSFQHVAVALRNQKVKIPNGNGQIAEVINSVSIPALNELTICFEVERTGSRQKEWLFTYYDINNNVALSFGYNQTGMEMVIDGVVCPVESIISVAEFTSSMKFFCVLWMSSNSRVAVYFNRRYYGKSCSPSSGHSVPAGGVFKLGGLGVQSFKGNMYNLRLWNRAMTVQELSSLTCDMVGNVIDWDNSQWTISSSLAQTDNTLSCICYPHCIHLTAAAPTSGSNPATGCDSGGLGCSAASSPTNSSTDSTNTSHAINAISHASPPPIPSTSTPSMPLTSAFSTSFSSSSTSSSSSSSASASINTTTTSPPSTTAPIASTSSTHVERTSATYPNSPRPKHKTLVSGLTPGRNFGLFQSIRRTRRALSSNPRSLTSSQFSPTGQDSRPPKSQHQPRVIASATGPASPVDPSRPRPPAAFRGSAFYHSPKHSLGFISTPLRKRPSGGRRPAATRATPSRVEVRVTKPSPLKPGLKSTASPSSRNTSPMLGNQLNSLISTAKSSSSTHNTTTVKTPTTSRDSETLLVPIPSRGSSPRQHKGEVSSSSGLSNRKSKPVAPPWFPLSVSGGDFLTRNWTDPLEYSSGSDMFMYDLGDMYEYDAVSSQEALPASSVTRVSDTLKEGDAKEISPNNTSLIEPEFDEPSVSLTETAASPSAGVSLEVPLKQLVAVSVSQQKPNRTPDSSLSVEQTGYLQITSSAKIHPSPVFLSLFPASLHPPSSPPSLLGPTEPPSVSSSSFPPLLQLHASPWVSGTSHPSGVPLPSPTSTLQMGFDPRNPSVLSHPLLSDSVSESQIPSGVGALFPESSMSSEERLSSVTVTDSKSDPLSVSDGTPLNKFLRGNNPVSSSPSENLSEVLRPITPSLHPFLLQPDLRDLKDVNLFPDQSHLGRLSTPARLPASLSSSPSDIFPSVLSDSLRTSSETSPPSVGNSKQIIGNPAVFLAQTSAAPSQVDHDDPFIQSSLPSPAVPLTTHRRTAGAQLGIPAPLPNNSHRIPNLAHTHQPLSPSVPHIPSPASFPSPPTLASSRATLATVSVTEAEIGFLSPTRPAAAFLNKHFQTPHRADMQPFELFFSLSGKQSSTLSGDEWEAIPSQPSLPARDAVSDEVDSHPANGSLKADASRIDSIFDLADVAPKMLPAEERVSEVGVSSTAESRRDGMQEAATGCLIAASKHTNNPSMMDASQQITSAVTPTPLPSSDPNPAASRSPTSSSIHAPNQDIMSGLKELSAIADTKNISIMNKDIILMLKDAPLEPAEVTNSTRPKNASEDSNVLEEPAVAKLNPASDPNLWNHGVFLKPSAATTTSSSSAAPLRDPSPTTLRPALSAGSCHCKLTFDFPCLCRESSGNNGLFYRVSFTVESELSQQEVQRATALWINQTFQNWTHSLDYIRVQQNGLSFTCQVLLMITNESLGEADVLDQLNNNPAGTSLLGQAANINVRQIENCPEDNNLHYLWPETKPRVTHFLPCFPNKDQSASRTCLINPETFQSVWSTANLTNCSVTAENAAGVAEQLANFTKNTLSTEEVSQVVTKVQELVSVAKIDTAVAESVVHIISNVMVSSEKASNIALKAVDELAKKVEFDGASVHINSKNLALGVLALDSRSFNGTSFSAFFPPNSTDPQIEFDRTANPLAQVTLPASLLSGVSADVFSRSSLSRINFMFFSSPSLFMKEQKGLSLNSYVVASSVGNISITDLQDPVKIEIAHLSDQGSSRRKCVFWDFSMNRGDGGWNNRGCSVSKESTSSRTICLCNHLTHFGILMDISQTSFIIDPENKKVLTFLSYIGCGISAICSAATLLTYIAFEKLRRDYPSKILMNLSTSLLFLNIVFLLDGWLASMVYSEGLCISAAVLLHYFLLTSFTWMGLESVHMYIALVKVFNTYIRRYILKFCIVGWGLPAVLVGIVVTANKDYYGVLNNHTDDSAMMCWIKEKSVFYTTCVGYFCLMFLLNVAMFIVVMMQICGRNGKRSNRTLREEILRNLRSVVSLTFLLGMTWGFALFAWGPVYLTFTYLFTIFNSLQGLFIFIFHCALKENVQKQWRRYLCCGPYRLSENSDWSKTATNNTKKVSSDNLAKSLSSSSFGSSTINWTSKAKATLTPFSKRNRNTDKCFSNQTSPKCVSSSSSSSDVEPNSSSSSSSSILPVSQMIDKVRDYCSTRTDNFYKNIIMSDSFANCTRL
ncbi:adhesion G-protein coupled receptor G6 isoform X2 [Poecilia formosa]|uniref:adhesion G-protein coupled receptor G6 isoform X2 n=1 Tax=Poecilia formosa TaxID=48698 RepID=UPI0007BA267A|nr:PREDICTED: G-protein coupled receptor 126 isoform X2 [Poecilia formosa]